MSPEEFANYKYESSSATNLLAQEHIEAIATRQWKKVLAWVAFHSDQVARAEDANGHTILHHAALFRAPAHVMEFLLWAAPELASVRNKDGELALHWAVRLSTPSTVLSLLLDADPESAFWADVHGFTPMSLLWERHQINLLQIWRTERRKLLEETDGVWKRIMSVYRALHDRSQASSSAKETTSTFQPLHLAAAHPSPPSLFPLMIQVYRHQLREADSQGRHALAIACDSPLANRSCDVLTKIQLLLREHPQGACVIDLQSGQYPLFIALSSGVMWDDGVESLIQAFPASLRVRDPRTDLFPFAVAAQSRIDQRNQAKHMAPEVPSSSPCLEVDIIYNTLRAEPSVLRLCGF